VTRAHLLATTAALLLPLAACGKKGPPLAPLRPAPGPVTEVAARRAGSEMQIRFKLPTQNVSGLERIDLEQIEIYAITVGPAGIVPPAREFLTRKYLVKTVPVKPPPVEGEVVEDAPAKPGAPNDTRPSPGDTITVVEPLTEAELRPVPAKPVVPVKGAPVVVPPVIDPAVTTRYYIVRGRSSRGEPGGAVRVALPVVAAPAPPADLKEDVTEKAVTLVWTAPPAVLDPVAAAMNQQAWKAANAPPPPPVVTPGRPRPAVSPSAPAFDPMIVAPLTRLPGVLLPAIVLPVAPTFNVYAVTDGKADDKPLNPLPLTVPTFSAGEPAWNVERCFIVRTVRTYLTVSIESEPAGPRCFTPIDTFAPAAPTGLRAVSAAGTINLIWDANSEPDLDGYLVLRGVAPGETLQALTPAPIRETNYRDTTVKAGVRYVYAIVAVDKAAKPNMSAQSPRQTEQAR
jgi:hypothetical protein